MFTIALALGFLAATLPAADLSRYRDIRFGTNLATVAKQTGLAVSLAKEIHRRPALIQELQWRPQSTGSSSPAEPVQDVMLSFYDGGLYRIAVTYDHYETEGLTAADIVDSVSTVYGTAVKPATAKAPPGVYGEQEEVIAEWQDAEYRFTLIRSSYGPSYKLVGVLKKLEEPVRAAIAAAGKLDLQEAPQREAAQLVEKDEAERVKLEKARLVNKPKFKP
jgi:hypothetical protein